MAQRTSAQFVYPSVTTSKSGSHAAPVRTEFIKVSKSQPEPSTKLREEFRKRWEESTADSNLTLYGFRRFKTSHLLNLRFLEAEIAEIDHDFYQAGLSLNIAPSAIDRLGLAYSKRDAEIPALEETITRERVLKLRELLKEYDEALSAFSTLMSLDTFSLLDNEEQCNTRTDLTLMEMYKSRQLRVDKRTRDRKDPLQCLIHKYLRDHYFRKLSNRARLDGEQGENIFGGGCARHQKNHDMIATWLGRLVIAVISAAFLTVPLGVLSYESRKGVQLAVVAICVVAFWAVVSVMLKASNLEMMVVSAGYAAVLSVFFSNAPPKT